MFYVYKHVYKFQISWCRVFPEWCLRRVSKLLHRRPNLHLFYYSYVRSSKLLLFQVAYVMGHMLHVNKQLQNWNFATSKMVMMPPARSSW